MCNNSNIFISTVYPFLYNRHYTFHNHSSIFAFRIPHLFKWYKKIPYKNINFIQSSTMLCLTFHKIIKLFLVILLVKLLNLTILLACKYSKINFRQTLPYLQVIYKLFIITKSRFCCFHSTHKVT